MKIWSIINSVSWFKFIQNIPVSLVYHEVSCEIMYCLPVTLQIQTKPDIICPPISVVDNVTSSCLLCPFCPSEFLLLQVATITSSFCAHFSDGTGSYLLYNLPFTPWRKMSDKSKEHKAWRRAGTWGWGSRSSPFQPCLTWLIPLDFQLPT